MRLPGKVTLILLCWLACPVRAADESDLFDLDLDQLLQLKTNIATLGDMPQRSSPAVITIISAEEIRDLNARDLIDVFQRVPGLNIAKDIDVSALMSRGLYAFEGRALFMVDGLPMTELLFGAYPIGNDFPIHLIKRIEIIRGPGSVVYGGTAETAVVNIITQEDSSEHAVLRYGVLPNAPGHADAGVRFGSSQGDWHMRGLAFTGNARRSDGQYHYFDQRPSFAHNERSAGIDSDVLVMHAGYGEAFDVHLLYQYYRNNIVRGFSVDSTQTPEEIAAALAAGQRAKSSPLNFDNTVLEADWHWWQGQHWSGRVSTMQQNNVPFDRPRRDDVEVRRNKVASVNFWRAPDWEWLLGAEFLQDRAHMLRSDDPTLRDYGIGLRNTPDDTLHESVTISSSAAFTNVSWSANDLHLFAGARYDKSDLFGSQLSPRLGLTYLRSDWHMKLLAANAFRAPLIANTVFSRFGYDPSLSNRQPVTAETARVYEWENGLLFTPNIFGSVNIFYQEIRDIIEFRYNVGANDLFSDNGGKLGTYGIENEWRYNRGPWNVLANLSYAAPKLFHDDNPDSYQAQPYGGDTYLALHEPRELMGAPVWKAFISVSFRFSDEWSWQANWLRLGPKNAAVGTVTGQTGTLPAQSIFDVGVHYQAKAWYVDCSVHDAFNERVTVVTPYVDSGFDTLDYKGRELSVDFGLSF